MLGRDLSGTVDKVLACTARNPGFNFHSVPTRLLSSLLPYLKQLMDVQNNTLGNIRLHLLWNFDQTHVFKVTGTVVRTHHSNLYE